jgi:hypothetical protein
MSGVANANVPSKISGGRGALKVDGLDSFNPSNNLRLTDNVRGSSKKKKKCCKSE